MTLLRAALLVAAVSALLLAGQRVTAYRHLAAVSPAAAAAIRAVQDVEDVAPATRARDARATGARHDAGRGTVADAATGADAATVTGAQRLLDSRAAAFRWWGLALIVTLVFGLVLAPQGSFFRSPRALAAPALVLVGSVATLWLEGRESRAVLALLGGTPTDAPGLWRLLTLSALLVTTATHIAVVGGALRAWIEQFKEPWARRAARLGAIYDRLVTRRAPASAGHDDATRADGTSTSPRVTGPRCDLMSFRRLMHLEWAGIHAMRARLDGRPPGTPAVGELVIDASTPADEPYVGFRAADLTGLALSGGGIRSATFNLGLLQGLHRLGLLRRVDYLSTVSGGGYIGSFWSRWLLARRFDERASPQTHADLFPARADGSPTSQLDSEQERHLREFGRFLSPRVGLLEVETWTALVAVISGLLPALAIALALIGMAFVLWLVLTVPLAATHDGPSLATLVALTAVVFAIFELLWQKVKLPLQDQSDARHRARRRDLGKLVAFSIGGIVLVATLHGLVPAARAWWRTPRGAAVAVVPSLPTTCAPHLAGATRQALAAQLPVRYVAPRWEVLCPGPRGWWALTGLAVDDTTATLFSPSLFDYAWVWLAGGLVLLLVRLIHPLFPLGEDALWVAPLDRVLMRLLGLAAVWTAVAALWHLALNLDRLLLSAATAIASAGAFALLRNWIGVALQRPEQPGAASRLRAILPQVLAYVTLLVTLATVGQGLIRLGGDSWPAWWNLAAVMSGVLVLGLFIDPSEFGLHAFYRARISRAYAGASNLAAGEGAAGNRQTDPRPHDDVPLEQLVPRPLHLVCCAANDLNGDDIGTLGRGARSAVLSRYGLAIGPFAAPCRPAATLGAAVTASAAAFNSNMGDVSMKLGPAVSFVMTALNLRLGLWLRHPAAHEADARRWPGLLLYREYFGLTAASGQILPRTVATRSGTQTYTVPDAPSHMRDVHLSDGGHFENLALYELVRRHCRYILASDCGADPTIAFDDLGRALRRIRQDFGIDITIDVEPLRPDADGRSRQHVAIGRIHYSPTDIGILVYVKPTLTGDEVADVLQYKTRNGAFPHEGTGDQFYDEAQWESYRRLGMHVAESVFGFARGRRDDSADWVFGEAALRWGTTPPDLEERVLEMTARVAELELDLQQTSARRLLREVFPELLDVHEAPAPKAHGAPATERAAVGSDDGAGDLVALLRVTQMMEDVWMACDLDTWWSHPLNMGWVNFFARWVTAPTFRFWWPFLGPMYSQGFRDFVHRRFPVPSDATGSGAPGPWAGQVRRVDGDRLPTGLAATWWATRSTQRCPWRGAAVTRHASAATPQPTYYENLLTLAHPQRGAVSVQVGLVATWEIGTAGSDETPAVVWTSDDFFVPPSLWGAGIGWHFLHALLRELATRHTRAFVVVRCAHDDAKGEEVRGFVDQYRKVGFRQRAAVTEQDPHPGTVEHAISALGGDATRDAIFELHLPTWLSRQDA